MTYIKIKNTVHDKTNLILTAIHNNPAQNLQQISKKTKIPTCRLSQFMQTFKKYGWVKIEKQENQHLHTITSKGHMARICTYFLFFNELPPTVTVRDKQVK